MNISITDLIFKIKSYFGRLTPSRMNHTANLVVMNNHRLHIALIRKEIKFIKRLIRRSASKGKYSLTVYIPSKNITAEDMENVISVYFKDKNFIVNYKKLTDCSVNISLKDPVYDKEAFMLYTIYENDIIGKYTHSPISSYELTISWE